MNCSFQFIEFPSEWGVEHKYAETLFVPRFQFIEFPSEWGVDLQHVELQLSAKEFPIY